MQAQLVRGLADPPQMMQSASLRKIVMLQVSLTSTGFVAINNDTIQPFIPGTAGVLAFRLMKISMWGPVGSASAAGGPLGEQWIALQMPGDTAFLDAATTTFEDRAMGTAIPPNIHVMPAFVQRQRWYSGATGGIPLFKIAANGGALLGTVIVTLHLSLELQLSPVTPTLTSQRIVSLPECPPLDDTHYPAL